MISSMCGSLAQAGAKPPDVLGRRANDDVHVLGGSHDAVKPHRRRADEHVLEARRLERAQHPQNLVPVHRPMIARPNRMQLAEAFERGERTAKSLRLRIVAGRRVLPKRPKRRTSRGSFICR